MKLVISADRPGGRAAGTGPEGRTKQWRQAIRGHGELWQAAQDRHALRAVTLLGGKEDQNGCGEKGSEWSMGQTAENGSQDSGSYGWGAKISSTKKSNIRETAHW